MRNPSPKHESTALFNRAACSPKSLVRWKRRQIDKQKAKMEKSKIAKRKSNNTLITLLNLCMSSLCRGHANLPCLVPISTDDPRRESERSIDESNIVHQTGNFDKSETSKHSQNVKQSGPQSSPAFRRQAPRMPKSAQECRKMGPRGRGPQKRSQTTSRTKSHTSMRRGEYPWFDGTLWAIGEKKGHQIVLSRTGSRCRLCARRFPRFV